MGYLEICVVFKFFLIFWIFLDIFLVLISGIIFLLLESLHCMISFILNLLQCVLCPRI